MASSPDMELLRSRGNSLRAFLLSEITENRIAVGAQLPAEHALMRRFALSRSTVRTVLQQLWMDGLVDRQRGRGTIRVAHNGRRVKTGLVGVWFNWPHGPLFGPIAQGIREELAQCKYHCVIEQGGLSPGDERRGLELLLQKALDGFIVAPSSNPDDDHAPMIALIEDRRPLVLVDRALPGYRTDLVTTHSELGAAEVVAHLVELGHRRIGFVGIEGLSTTDERLQGYRQTMAEHRLPVVPNWVQINPRIQGPWQAAMVAGDVVVDSGGTCISVSRCRSVVRQLLDGPTERRPSALFVVNDAVAGLVVRVIRELGFRVPEDMSVAGFDDVQQVDGPAADITTYVQPAYSIGQQAARLLMQRIESPIQDTTQVLLAGRLVKRGSTAPPGRAAANPAVQGTHVSGTAAEIPSMGL